MKDPRNESPACTASGSAGLLITKEIIRECICGKKEGKAPHRTGRILAVIMLVIGIIFLVLPPLGLIFLGLAALFFFLSNRSNEIYRAVDNLQYVIYEDTYLHTSEEEADDNAPYSHTFIHLTHHGKVECHFPHLQLRSVAAQHASDLYTKSHTGDPVYLLCTAKGKILFIFHSSDWTIDENDFVSLEHKGQQAYIPKE